MFLHMRHARPKPATIAEALIWAAEVTEVVNDITDMDLRCWHSPFAPHGGEIVWTAAVQDHVHLDAVSHVLASDAAYQSMLARVEALLEPPIVDRLIRLVGGQRSDTPGKVILARAIAAPGTTQEAIAVTLQMAERVEAASESTVLVGTGLYDEAGSVYMATSLVDAAATDALIATLVDDPEWVRLDAEANRLFREAPTRVLMSSVA